VAVQLSAEKFIEELRGLQSDAERAKIRRYFRIDDADNQVIGVRMKHTFDLAKAYAGMPLPEVAALLDSPYYESRMGAVSIMDFKARSKRITDQQREELFALYLGRHDRINSWDFVDRAAPRVVGWYLLDKPREVLYDLARSPDIWRRRTAMVASWFFIRHGDLDDAYAIAGILLHDPEDLINKAVGTSLRYAGERDVSRLTRFLDEHAAGMPRVTLRYALEKLEAGQRQHYLALGRTG
jgi:3-methyladenine DNA glycosylase AlkD